MGGINNHPPLSPSSITGIFSIDQITRGNIRQITTPETHVALVIIQVHLRVSANHHSLPKVTGLPEEECIIRKKERKVTECNSVRGCLLGCSTSYLPFVIGSTNTTYYLLRLYHSVVPSSGPWSYPDVDSTDERIPSLFFIPSPSSCQPSNSVDIIVVYMFVCLCVRAVLKGPPDIQPNNINHFGRAQSEWRSRKRYERKNNQMFVHRPVTTNNTESFRWGDHRWSTTVQATVQNDRSSAHPAVCVGISNKSVEVAIEDDGDDDDVRVIRPIHLLFGVP